jgi:hypothetical protein
MFSSSSLYRACGELFARHPLAVRPVDWNGDIRSMVLMMHHDNDAVFFVLAHDCSEGRSFYSLRPWHAGWIVNIEADGGAVPDGAVTAVTRGIPLPRHGSLFGWRRGDVITALIAVYAKYSPAHPEPSWSVMPLAGAPASQWPPFAGEQLIGSWFWMHHRAGDVVSLAGLIAATADTVFWPGPEANLGWDCCAVARDIRSREGFTLRRGLYVYYRALRADKPTPPLDLLLSDPGKTDLAPRFRRFAAVRRDPVR